MTTTNANRDRKGDTRIEIVHLENLRPVARRPALPAYIKQLWNRRFFIIADSRARVTSGNRRMFLGNTWLVLRPVLDATVYFLIFGMLLQSSRGIDNFIGYLIVGVFLFRSTARCLMTGATSVTGGRNLIRSFTFPRAALPIAAVVKETLSMIPVLVTMMVIIVVIPPHAEVSWRWLLFPLVFALQVVFNTGLALGVARLVARFRDLNNVLSFVTRFWLYGSAVFFSYDRFVDHPTVLLLMKLNPMFIVLDVSRDVLVYAQTPELRSWFLLSGWALIALIVGFVYFWRGEETYGRD